MMGRAHHPTSSTRSSSRTVSSPISASSSHYEHMRQFSGMRPHPSNIIDLTMSPPLSYSPPVEPHHQRGSPAASYSSPTRASQRFSAFQRVASSPSSSTNPPPPPPPPPPPAYTPASAPSPASTSGSPTSIITSSLPFAFPTWDTAGPSSHPSHPTAHPSRPPAHPAHPPHPAPNTGTPRIPRPIRRMPRGCTQTMLDVASYPTRPGFTDFYGPDSPIPFKGVGEEGHAALSGTSMRDALCGTGMRGPRDRVFEHRRAQGKRAFTFVLRWPGYSGIDWSVSIPIVDARQEAITREELAHRIAVEYHNFALLCALIPTFGSPQSPAWKLSEGGYTFDRMRLINLNRVDEDVWVADVCVISDEGYRGGGRLRDIWELEY